MTNLLELKNVTKRFKTGTVAMDNISFAVDAQSPSIIAVAGESGSGKTTLAMMALGFLEPTTGQVLYKGQEIQKLKGAAQMQFRKEVQAVFQDPFAVYNPFYKVDHIFNVAVENFKLANSKAEGRRKIEDALVSVGLRPEETLGRYPHQLSGGQRQRLVVARALLLSPQLLVADEPVSMVDASLRATILETLRKLKDNLGITILYITHDLTTAYHVCDQIIVLYKGSVMEAGDVEAVIASPQHPYTQLLIDSIPWPDLNRKWGQQPVGDEDKSKASKTGCKFAGRCPYVMEQCRQAPAPLYKVDDNQVAACYLHEGKAQLPNEQLGDLFKPRGTKTAS